MWLEKKGNLLKSYPSSVIDTFRIVRTNIVGSNLRNSKISDSTLKQSVITTVVIIVILKD
jgi:hypothetical protein